MICQCLSIKLPLYPFYADNLISNSPYYLLYNFNDVSSENLVLDQTMIPQLMFFCILIISVIDVVLILLGEILS